MLIIVLFASCKQTAENYNLGQGYDESGDSDGGANIPEPDSDFIYTTTSATSGHDTLLNTTSKDKEIRSIPVQKTEYEIIIGGDTLSKKSLR